MPTLFITRPLPEVVLAEARLHFDVTVRDSTLATSKAELMQAMAHFDAVLPTLGDPLDGDVFKSDAQCKILANFGVGYNHIDVAAAQVAGIVVSNTPGAVTDATADIAVMLMLMAARRASEGEVAVRSGKWTGWHPTQFLGLHVSGKTLGVIGMGRIGQAVARRSHFGFGMDVVFHNRSKVTDCGIPGARQLESLNAVMAVADVVTVCVPGGPANHHLVNADALDAMHSHAVIVNTARGDVVDEAALIAVLQSGGIAGAGLDVYEDEPEVPAALLAMPNVTLLPHLGTNAMEVRSEMGLMAVKNLRAFFAGDKVPNRI